MTQFIASIILILIIFVAMWTDYRKRMIPNWLTFSGILSGVLFHGLTNGWNGLAFAGSGFGVGLLILLFPFIKGGIGAGDVKLMAAIGTWMGVEFMIPACLWMGVLGALLSLLTIGKQRIWMLALIGLTSKGYKTGVTVPYGIAIGLGTLIEMGRVLVVDGGGFL